MSNQRFESAPKFIVGDNAVIIQSAVGSTQNLLSLLTHSGEPLMTVSPTGQMESSAQSTFSAVIVTDSISLPLGVSLESPVLTGTPTSTTATPETNSTQIATTEFVKTAISNLISSAPTTLDTLDELAAALGDDSNFASTVTTSLATKAPIESPALTGTPTAPLAATGTDTTQLATTSFVQQELGVFLPAGMIAPYAGSSAPNGWLLCVGQTVSRTTYSRLFTAIGTTYGAGDGSTTFAVPDLRGRVVAGIDNMGGSAAGRLSSSTITGGGDALGEVGGTETVTLTSAQSGVPAHSHANTLTNNAVNTGNDSPDHTHSGTTGNDSPDHAHGVPIGVAQEGGFTGIIGTSGHNGNVHPWTASASSNGASTRHNHSFSTGGRSAFHQHSVTSNVTISNVNNTAANASSAHSNVQPTMVLNYIIKV